MAQDDMIVRCPKCGTKNRIPKERMQERPVCGRCHAHLDEMLIGCLNCGKKNRMPENRLDDRPYCGHCGLPLVNMGTHSAPLDISDGVFNKEVLLQSGAVLMDCWAPWCGPCRLAEPILVELAAQYAGIVKIVKLNVDENPKTAAQYQVQSIPTMLLFKDGKLVNRLVGLQPKEEIIKHVQALLQGAR